MNVTSPGLKFYVDKINAGERFSFVRYGNGEWDCILGLYHKTRSGSQKFTPDLRKALAASLTQHRTGEYYRALQSASFLKRIGILPKAEAWLAENKLRIPWHDGEVFTKASMKGQFHPLITALKKQRVVVVGPKWLSSLPFASVFVPVASHNCWSQIEGIKAQLRNVQNAVVSFSAGPATKVLIHYLQPIIGNSCWLIDFGSIWDPYCGVKSRRYHQRMTADVIRKNMAGK